MIGLEEKRLNARRKAAERKGEWLRQYLSGNMEPGTNLKDARAVIAWRKSTAVDIEIKPEYLQAEDARQATQKAVCAKLLKVEDIAGVETIFDWAEVELKRQLMIADRYIVFFQIAEMVILTEDHYKAMRKIFVRMNKD